MALISAHQTDAGRESGHNQDFIRVHEQIGLFIVADGMGGAEAGELASELAAMTTSRFIEARLKTPPKELLVGALEAANEAVMEKAIALKQSRPMGAAIVVALVIPPKVYITHAGDARAYLGHLSTFERLTTDDSWVARLVESGVISEEQARHHPLGNILTKAIGHETPLEPAFTEVAITSGDFLLLCSDGVWKMLADEQIQAILDQPDVTLVNIVEQLVGAANEAGGKDNISVALVKIVD
jgi:protein phosphatase